MNKMKLELITIEPKGRPRAFPVLFIHGIYHGAWCWEKFMPYFSEHGYRCHAMSLRGHGGSEGGAVLARARFSDYLQDVDSIVRQLGNIPILIGHSLGGILVQKYIETRRAPAAVCISSPTLRSLAAAGIKMMRQYPRQTLKAMLSLNTDHIFKDPLTLRTLFFSRNLPDDQFDGFMKRFYRQNESRRVYFDVLLLRFKKPKGETPFLVVGGAQDYGVNPSAFWETAARYGNKPLILDDMPHDMLLEDDYRVAADGILDWLDQRYPLAHQ